MNHASVVVEMEHVSQSKLYSNCYHIWYAHLNGVYFIVYYTCCYFFFRQECENEGGTESGSCADGMLNQLSTNLVIKHFISLDFHIDLQISLLLFNVLGFGVCCVLILSDGDSTSLNQSYIVQAASTALGVGSRQYTICPCSTDVCRIKFDFTVSNLYLVYVVCIW